MIILIDNYDSFTYNLAQQIGQINPDIQVIRNNDCSVDQILSKAPSHIIISPGPGRPENAGCSNELIRAAYQAIPILGVCLGHQCIAALFGGKINHAKTPIHGKTSKINHNEKGIFKNIPNPFMATRYHSLIVEKDTVPKELEITAQTQDQEIMALRHKQYPLYGVQFHPESILTQHGNQLISNFISQNR